MTEIPQPVKETFDRLKKSYPFYSVLKVSGSHGYYVYRQTSKWDKKSRKVKSAAEYLGKINQQGIFIKKGGLISDEHITATPAPALPMADHEERGKESLNDHDLVLLKMLSMNARADVSFLGRKLLGLKPSAALYRAKQLERRLGIRYFAEIDVGKLGHYGYYTAFVKFQDRKPQTAQMKESLEGEHRVQLAFTVRGGCDLIIFFLAENNDDAADFLYNLRGGSPFGDCPSEWNVAPFYMSFGCIPLRDEFFELLRMQNKVWNRTEESPRPTSDQLTMKEYCVLRALNGNGAEDFTSIDAKYRFKGEGADYTYHKLKDSGVLKRITLTVQNLPIRYLSILLMKKIDGKKVEDCRKALLCNILDGVDSQLDRYSLVGDTGVPDGGLFIAPVYTNSDFSALEQELQAQVQGTVVNSLVVTDTIVGGLCFRKFDAAYSKQYAVLVKQYKAEQLTRINYEETARKKHILKTEDYIITANDKQ